jgi:hypothetical protein
MGPPLEATAKVDTDARHIIGTGERVEKCFDHSLILNYASGAALWAVGRLVVYSVRPVDFSSDDPQHQHHASQLREIIIRSIIEPCETSSSDPQVATVGRWHGVTHRTLNTIAAASSYGDTTQFTGTTITFTALVRDFTRWTKLLLFRSILYRHRAIGTAISTASYTDVTLNNTQLEI